jgi:hypothetical protein
VCSLYELRRFVNEATFNASSTFDLKGRQHLWAPQGTQSMHVYRPTVGIMAHWANKIAQGLGITAYAAEFAAHLPARLDRSGVQAASTGELVRLLFTAQTVLFLRVILSD